MGTVYEVRDRLRLHQRLALKTLGEGSTEAEIRDFRREFALLARLHHPHLARVVDFRADVAGRPYLTMDTVDGPTLAAAAPLPATRAWTAGLELARALAFLDARGVRHGDVNPHNVVLGPEGLVLVDFGLAALRGDRRSAGTPRYAAPETLREGAGAPADVYGLGATLYEALTGRAFLPGGDVVATLTDPVRYEAAWRAGLSALPEGADLLGRLLAYSPAGRPSIDQALAELAGGGPLESALTRSAYVTGADLVGREGPLATLESWLGGDRRPALVSGPDGIGKRRIVRALRVRAQHAGLRVLSTRLSARGTQGLDSLLADILLSAPDAAIEACGPWLRWRIDHPRLADVEPAPRLDPVADGAAWARAAARCLTDEVTARGRPTVVILEGLHTAGADTHAVLEAMLPSEPPLQLLLTSRTTEGPTGALHVPLGPLGRATVPAICRAVFGTTSEALEAAVEGLRGAVDGVPFSLFGALRRLVERGRIDRRAEGWVLDGPLRDEDLPADAVAAARAAVAALSAGEAEGRLLVAMAALGRPAELGLLRRVADVSALPRFEGQGVVEAVGSRFRIADPLVETALAKASDAALHLDLAEATQDADERAHHGDLGDHPQAAAWLEAAARAATSAFDDARALGHCERWAARADCASARRLEGDALARLGRPDDALAAYARGLELAAPDERPPIQARIGRVHRQRGRFEEALTALDAALGGDGRTRLEAHGEMGTVRWMQTRYDDAAGAYRAQLAAAEALGDVAAQGRASGNIGRVHLYQRRYGEALECFERQREVAEQVGDLPQLSLALGNVGIVHRRCGRYGEALRCYERKRSVCERTGDRRDMGLCWGNLAVVHWYSGEVDAAIRCCEKQLEVASAVGDRQSECSVHGNMGQFLVKRGDYARAEAEFTEALRIADELGLPFYGAHYRLGRAGLLGRLRRWRDAASDAADAQRMADEIDDDGLRFSARLACARIDARGARDRATEEMEALLVCAQDDEQRADVHYELAELGAEGAHAQTARHLYERLYADAPTASFRERAAELMEMPGHATPPPHGRDAEFDELLALVHCISRQTGTEQVIEQLVGLTQSFLGAERGMLLRPGPDGELEVASARDAMGVRLDGPDYSHTVVDRVVRTRAPLFAPDILAAGALADAGSVRSMSLRAAMCLPLLDGARLLGVMYFDGRTRADAGRFEGKNLGYVQALADQAVVALGHAEQLELLQRAVTDKTREVARHLEALERSNSELLQFASVASHDLREPLRTIGGFVELLRDRQGGQLDDESREFLTYIEDGASRMRAMVNDLLDYARLGSDTSLGTVELDIEMRRVAHALSHAVETSGARLTYDPLPAVIGDASQLERLLQNLVANAIKFRAEGRIPEIHVGVESLGELVTISVRDNGIGIAPAQRGRVFDTFTRLHPRSRYEGTGLGLAMCRRIVDRHGGTIRVEPSPGEGSTFIFTLMAAV